MRLISIILLILSAKSLLAQDSQGADFKPYKQNIPGTSLSFAMAPIPAGNFVMGSGDKAIVKKGDEVPAHKVEIEAFWMGAYEVTYDEYDVFSKDENLSSTDGVDAVTRPTPPYIDLTLGMGKAGGYPANSMQQYGAIMYCKWLYKKTGIFFRLPSEAEWEYACRAGATTEYPFGNDSTSLAKYAWYTANSGGHYHKVGELQPNTWGLYDMLGNVGEWTLDQYDENFYGSVTDGAVNPVRLPTNRHPRTVRGGTYQDDAASLRSAARLKSNSIWNRRDPQIPKSKWWNADAPFIGFRIIRPLKQPTTAEAETFFNQYLFK